jgi:cytochrome c-type biogenesis protein CcmH/NrfG
VCENPPPFPNPKEHRTVNRNVVIALVAGLVAGLAIGYSFGSNATPSGPVVAAPVAMPIPNPAPGGMGGGMPPPGMPSQQPAAGQADYLARIAQHEGIVKANPKDVKAWIQLGNDYFDTHQHQKSIDAYAKALALEPNNADVLTDQGIMYREAQQFEAAARNFEKASQVNPRHLQSLFNLGVVYAYDLKQTDKAVAAWSRVIQIDPTSTQAIQARTALQGLGVPK